METLGKGIEYLGNIRGLRGPRGGQGEPGLPGVNAVPADEAVAEYLTLQSAQTRAAAQALLVEDRRRFAIEEATLEYGARAVRPKSENRVMQSIAVSYALGGEIWYSQVAAGTATGRETTVVVRCTPAGAVLDEMHLIDAGHATGVFVEVDAQGRIWVWSSVTNQAINSGDGRFHYARVPWKAGGSYTFQQMSGFLVTAISGKEYLTAHFDELNGIVGVRRNLANGDMQFESHTLANLLAGVKAPTQVFTHRFGADYYGQGWCLLDGYWYVLSGSSEENSPVFPAQVWRLDPITGTRTYVRSVEAARLSAHGKVHAGFAEPEGIAVARGPKGEPALAFGMSTGPTGGRAYTFWSLHMGVPPFVNSVQRGDAEWGDTGWTDTGMLTWSNGFAAFTADTPAALAEQQWQIRVAGGYLEIRGRVDGKNPGTGGNFTAGTNVIGQLRDGYFSKTRHLRGVIVKSSGAGSANPIARVDINTSGGISVTLDNSDGPSSWVDFTGFRVPLAD